jgi:hypothetical protein
MSARASADCTSMARANWRRRRISDPTVPPPAKFEPTVKAKGSFVLDRGKWVEIEE